MANDRYHEAEYYGSGFAREQMIRKRRDFEKHMKTVMQETGMGPGEARKYIEEFDKRQEHDRRCRYEGDGMREMLQGTSGPEPDWNSTVITKAVNLLKESCNKDGLTRRNRLLLLAAQL